MCNERKEKYFFFFWNFMQRCQQQISSFTFLWSHTSKSFSEKFYYSISLKGILVRRSKFKRSKIAFYRKSKIVFYQRLKVNFKKIEKEDLKYYKYCRRSKLAFRRRMNLHIFTFDLLIKSENGKMIRGSKSIKNFFRLSIFCKILLIFCKKWLLIFSKTLLRFVYAIN
jgi:hypothetical protein